MSQAVPSSQNWVANLSLEFAAGRHKTLMIPQRRIGPLLVQRPFYPEQQCCHSYLLHPPGGVVGGDHLDLQISLQPRAQALLTTPGATKFYQSAGETAHYLQSFSVGDSASLEFMPHENIYFPGARVQMHSKIDLHSTGVTMLWEKHCFGRPVISETFSSGRLLSRLDVTVDGELALTETQRIDAEEIERASGLRGYPVMGTFVISGQQVSSELQQAIAALGVQQGYGAVTRPIEGLLVLRYLGASTADMNRYFIAAWQLARPVLTGRPAVAPRIWAT